METLFCTMRDTLKSGGDLVLCTIIASSGSTPRGSGAKMAVFADGSTLGTVGGGAVEYESVRLAKKALAERTAFTHGFNLSHNQTADIGMICGGQVVVYFQFFGGGDAPAIAFFEAAAEQFAERKNTWLITQISEGGVKQMGIYSREEGLRYLNDGIDEWDILPLVRPRAVLKKGERSYYVEPLTTSGYAYIFGGGHVAQELVPVIARVGFAPVVFEDRPDFARKELFPEAAETIVGSFTDIGASVSITPDDYVIIMTRGHQADFDRWGAVQMVQNLEGMGFTVVPFGQGFKDMSPPTKESMKLTLEQRIAHGGQPVLRWMMDNIYIRTDPAGNIKPDKEKSTEKIDGAVATIMALDRALRNGGSEVESVYDTRGLLVF